MFAISPRSAVRLRQLIASRSGGSLPRSVPQVQSRPWGYLRIDADEGDGVYTATCVAWNAFESEYVEFAEVFAIEANDSALTIDRIYPACRSGLDGDGEQIFVAFAGGGGGAEVTCVEKNELGLITNVYTADE